MAKYIESKLNPDGVTFDHTEVRAAYTGNSTIFYRGGREKEYKIIPIPVWLNNLQYKVEVADTYGIHESSSTLREGGPAVAEMLLDRIKELEAALSELADWAYYEVGADEDLTPGLTEARKLLNKEQK